MKKIKYTSKRKGMKETVVVLLLCLVTLFSLSSCNYIAKFDSCHPVNQLMSKWVGENIELYIVDPDIMDNPNDIMIVNYGDKKLAYYVWWQQNYATVLSMRDTREGVYVEEVHPSYDEDCYHYVSGWNIELIDEAHCKLKNGPKFADLDLPEEVVLTRVATNLTKEDIPQYDINEQYDFCPTYYYGTKWRSNDNQFEVKIESNNGIGVVTFVPNIQTNLLMYFVESNSSAYLIEPPIYRYDSELEKATEHWKCEYFEHYFVATVVRSEYYEPGHVLTFNRVTTNENSTE